MPRRSRCLVCGLLLAACGAFSARADSPVNRPRGDPGALPVGDDGRPLNFDFETGTLQDWTEQGDAWRDQPIKGEISEQPGRPLGVGKKSLHTGDYWLGGFEKHQDKPRGTLTSAPFKVTQAWASFLLGGGSHLQTRVELVSAADDRVFFRISGVNQEELRPVVVNLQAYAGKLIYIRIIDDESGGWGHVNFDDFRLHARRPRFEQTPLEPRATLETTEVYPHAGLAAADAARAMQLPPGFSVQVAAAEPDVMQPIAMAIDDRGRVWIAEAYEYPQRAEPGQGQDRILIFEDTDLDGTLDSRKVFAEGLGRMLALTVNDEVNTLATQQFADVFGRGEVYQLTPKNEAREKTRTAAHLRRGRFLFGAEITFDELQRRHRDGAHARKTPFDVRLQHGRFPRRARSRCAAAVSRDRTPPVAGVYRGFAPTPKAGDSLISLVPRGSPANSPSGDSPASG